MFQGKDVNNYYELSFTFQIFAIFPVVGRNSRVRKKQAHDRHFCPIIFYFPVKANIFTLGLHLITTSFALKIKILTIVFNNTHYISSKQVLEIYFERFAIKKKLSKAKY